MADFSNYLSPGRKGYLIGIGGVSMSSLAEVLQGLSKDAPETVMLPGQPYAGDEGIWMPNREQIKEKIKTLFPKADENAEQGK